MKIAALLVLCLFPATATTVVVHDPAIVTVCLDYGAYSPWVAIQAQITASKIFERVGIHLEWHRLLTPCKQDSDGIHITFTTGAPDSKFPGALGMSRIGDGSRRIEIFFDRVQRTVEPSLVPYLLGHVFAHEITHVLEGLNRHSTAGLMKPEFLKEDYRDMREKPLELAPEDVALLQARFGTGTIRLAQRQGP